MSKKLVTCKACGEEIDKKCKKCPKCGAKNKKPIFKKWWFWLIVVVVIGAIGSGGDDTASESVPTTPPTIEATVAQEVTEPATEPPTEPATEPATEPPTEPVTEPTNQESEQETASRASLVDLWKLMVEVSARQNYDYYDISADETGAIVSIATNGFSESLAQLKAYGYDENYEHWVTAKNSLVGLNTALCDGAEDIGLDDFPVMLILVNDLNHDDMLLIINNGEIIFDCMAN